MLRFLAGVSLVLASGCTLSLISGYEDGGTGSSSGGTGSGSGRVSITSGGATGQAATGSGTVSGGQGTGSAASTGGSTGRAGGSTTGCAAFGSTCLDDAQCCSGACNVTCGQPFGMGCLNDSDCTSRNCANGQCACAQSQGAQFGFCASDQDCCGGLDCQHFNFGSEVGLCCIPDGASCAAGDECCNQNCVDGQCQCLPAGSDCGSSLDDCCSGICTNLDAPLGVNDVCQSPPGGECTLSTDCTSQYCDGGFCAGCGLAEATCSSTLDCCTGLACAASLSVFGGPNAPIVDGGTTCCGQAGTSCDASDGGGCCGTCDNGTCACVPATNQCDTDQSCCAGGACMRSPHGNGPLACCQLDGQFCLADDECCTGNCGEDQKCACIADGGACGGSLSVEGPAACCSGQCANSGLCL